MQTLTGFLVTPRKEKKPFWKTVGLVETFRMANGGIVHKIPHFNLRVEDRKKQDASGKRYFDVFNVMVVDGKTQKTELCRAYPLKNTRHGFTIPSLNYTAMIPKTR